MAVVISTCCRFGDNLGLKMKRRRVRWQVARWPKEMRGVASRGELRITAIIINIDGAHVRLIKTFVAGEFTGALS